MVYCIGLTGHLASGKSTVAHYFAQLGVDVIHADEIAKELTARNQPAYREIIHHFGTAVLTSAGELDRRHMRQLIFSKPDERIWLENLLHPLIRKEIEYKVNQSQAPYCLIEIPLLTERSHYPYLNRVLLVQTTPEQQISRFVIRDNGTKEDALAILATQPDKTKLLKMADDILMNTGSVEGLQEKIRVLHNQYLGYAGAG